MIAGRVIGVILLALSASPLQAQPAEAPAGAQPTSRKQIVDEMVAAGVAAAAHPTIPRPFQTPFGTGRNGKVVAYLIAAHTEREGYKALLQALEARALKQLGATPGSSGSTSLAMNGLVPDILGIAVESGAINRDVSGTTVTFRATPSRRDQIAAGQGLVEINSDYANSTPRAWRVTQSRLPRASTPRRAGTPDFTADSRQPTGWSARAELVNHRDPASGNSSLVEGSLRNEDAYLRLRRIDRSTRRSPRGRRLRTGKAARGGRTAGVEISCQRPQRRPRAPASGGAGSEFREAGKAGDAGHVLKALDGYVAQR